MTFHITNLRKRTHIVALSMTAAGLLCSPFVYAEQGGTAAARARYEQERSRCQSGQSGQDLKTCMREAGAALQEAQQGRLDGHDASYARNALERCKPLPAEDAKDCRDRILGQGAVSISGSVKGGGLYREKVTTEVTVLPPPPAPPQEVPPPMPSAPAPAPVK